MEKLTLHIENFGDHQDGDLEINNLTLLSGINGTNKMNILWALTFYKTKKSGLNYQFEKDTPFIGKRSNTASIEFGGFKTMLEREGKMKIKGKGDSPDYVWGGVEKTDEGYRLAFTVNVIPGSFYFICYPEEKLHPKLQSQIGKQLVELAKKGVRVIVISHSDYILLAFRKAVKRKEFSNDDITIHYFYRNDKNTIERISPKILEDGCVDIWPDGFFDQFDKDLVELF